MTNERLPRELLWEGAHVSELALTAIADGQEAILGDGAVEHVEACERCTSRLGRIALVSSTVGEALVHARGVGASEASSATATAVGAPRAMPGGSARATAGRPLRALAVGLAVAMLAAVPAVNDILRAPAFASTLAAHAIKALVHLGVALATSHSVSRGLPSATLAASALLSLLGWVIALTVSRGTSLASEGSKS
jgi:hypothetical protein